MNRKLIYGLLIIISVSSLTFGFYQKDRADKNESKAKENEALVEKMKVDLEMAVKMASEQQKIAEMNMMEAIRQRQIADEEKEKTKGKR